jgi:hypothetical protein
MRATTGLGVLAVAGAVLGSGSGRAFAQDPPAPSAAEVARAADALPALAAGGSLPRAGGRWGAACRRWEIRLEVGAGGLDPTPDGILGEPLPAGAQAFDFGQAERRVTGAARLGARWRPDPLNSGELRGTWYGQWAAQDRQTGQFAFTNAAGISPVATATLKNVTRLGGIELNWWRQLACWREFVLEAGLGARWMRFDEWAEAYDWAGLAADSFLQGRARNDVYAGQFLLGGEAQLGRFTVGLDARVFLGGVRRDVQVRDVSILAAGPHQAREQRDDFAWGGELGAWWRWRFSERWSATLAYDFLFLDGVSRAVQGLDFSQAATGAVGARPNQGRVFAHVVFVGLELRL